ncbi:MAG: hypothetical protein J5784_03945 [Muribaculaceae bacterium]|nr:hypothetical protein [Muribaculaceae bacterium]
MKKTILLTTCLFAASALLTGSISVYGSSKSKTKSSVTKTAKNKITTASAGNSVNGGDLSLFDLTGPVKSVVINIDDYPVRVSFSQNGLATMPQEYESTLSRDRNSLIKSGLYPADSHMGDFWMKSFVRDKKGRVTRIIFESSTGGHLIYANYTYASPTSHERVGAKYTQGRLVTIIKYTILERDSHGNWTRRSEYNATERENEIVRRVITYWDE